MWKVYIPADSLKYRVKAAYTLFSLVRLLEPVSENAGRSKWVSSLTVKDLLVGLSMCDCLNDGSVSPT